MQKVNPKKKKICLVVSSLGKGGAERSSALLSKMLVGLGYNVHIVSVLNRVEYSYEGKLLNLGELKDKDDSFLGRILRFNYFKKYLKKEEFDLIIDNRTRPKFLKEFLINKIIYNNQKLIFVIRNRNLSSYLPKNKVLSKIVYNDNQSFVGVSNEIAKDVKSIYNFKTIFSIYNPVDFDEINQLAEKEIDIFDDYILFYGRLYDKAKNISLLIDSYKKSNLSSSNIKLLILGDGEDFQMLKDKANHEQIIFKPFTNNPFPYVKKAKFCCLTSNYEGFPRVLIESLSLGTPVVSVNCSGSREIVKNEFNGLLVESNEKAYSDALNSFVENQELYLTCKSNAIESVKDLSIKEIAKKWQQIIEKVT